MMAIGRQPRPICHVANDIGGIANGKCLVSTVPSPTHTAPAKAQRYPGTLPRLASNPLPAISTLMPASAIESAMARIMETRSPRIGHANSATHTGMEMPSTAASLAGSQSSANPMNATQLPMVRSDTTPRRSHIARGTARRSPLT